ncbi:hypothetical protein RJ639_018948 [Escallonia herrerae]|uniref:GAG-pre-integrase domain-containing protein n=1 Tax=Escallonia herrerae TaxID=1293975 RepID=A0AA88VAK5_9ASTE|nr:hypothetical protein RJ639_018948 [Escallonia herrerae]
MGSGGQTKCKGTVTTETKEGAKFIRNFLLVPDLQQSLSSVGQLVENGYFVHFEEADCNEIYDNSKGDQLIANIKMEKNRSYPVEFKYAGSVALKCVVEENIWLWHMRFCHLNFNGLKLLQRKYTEKPEAFIVFKRFKALVEKQSGCDIKLIRSDRVGEYTSN